MNTSNEIIKPDYLQFLAEIKERIYHSRHEAAKAVNREIIQLYWDIGHSITEKQQSAGWGKSVVETLANDLQKEFPGMSGFSARNIWYMQQFYAEYHGNEILQPLVGEISWSKHLVIMSKCKDMQERQFYIRATKKYGWTKDVLTHHVTLKTYERYDPSAWQHTACRPRFPKRIGNCCLRPKKLPKNCRFSSIN
ncbi:MAG: DUF1016 N-terminal domain-containing protein [Bacteroidales bacterium]|jgi:predicted nuclease of restriction endonuclease-like (RecB) superfamily|nr:DUF1016 N-terminal domain-containing protein [Bacteroidales bacterium]